ncbi:MAG: hypothetical protein FJ294_01670 [Planctomycetes bacterium]|nr:hypothetical protein [Planctomycetota bacterium]
MASPTTTSPAPPRSPLPCLDAGGLKRLEWFRVELETPGATARLARARLEDRRGPAPSTFLQGEPALTREPLPEGELTVEAQWHGSRQRALVSALRELLPAGRCTVEASLGRTPIFARVGRILVTSPAEPHSAAQRLEEPELQVYFDPRRPAKGQLLDDDGESSGNSTSTTDFSARIARGRVLLDALCNGIEVVDRGWHVHAHGLPQVKG